MTCVWRAFAKQLALPIGPRRLLQFVKQQYDEKYFIDVLCNDKKCEVFIHDQNYKLIQGLDERRVFHDGYFFNLEFDPLCMFFAQCFNIEIYVEDGAGCKAAIYTPIAFFDEAVTTLARSLWLSLHNTSSSSKKSNKKKLQSFPRKIKLKCEEITHLTSI